MARLTDHSTVAKVYRAWPRQGTGATLSLPVLRALWSSPDSNPRRLIAEFWSGISGYNSHVRVFQKAVCAFLSSTQPFRPELVLVSERQPARSQ
jgi:hypothetical protein